MWQSLVEGLKDQPFVVIAVALDGADAARPWVDAAKATYPCLIDSEQHVADLYNFTNVPQAVWIDEHGRIVRPPETAGSTDAFRAMDRKTGAVPDDVAAERNRVKARYFDAVRDWVLHGSASANALDRARAAARLNLPDERVAEAHARFRLGRHLLTHGQPDEGHAQIARATELHPDSWAMWRYDAPKNERGLASGPDFWARVEALGGRPYYPPADIAEVSG